MYVNMYVSNPRTWRLEIEHFDRYYDQHANSVLIYSAKFDPSLVPVEDIRKYIMDRAHNSGWSITECLHFVKDEVAQMNNIALWMQNNCVRPAISEFSVAPDMPPFIEDEQNDFSSEDADSSYVPSHQCSSTCSEDSYDLEDLEDFAIEF